MAAKVSPNALDRLIFSFAPSWGLTRYRARLAFRHYEAAQPGHRTMNWNRSGSDANAAAAGALAPLRYLSRDLVRNNGWARNAIRIIHQNTVGWGIVAKPVGEGDLTRFAAAWEAWAGSTQCDADGRLNFYGLEKLVMRTVAQSGEALVRKRPRRAEDGLAIPLQLQVLEPDLIDTSKEADSSDSGGPIIQGVEHDKLGRRTALWLYDSHPGSSRVGGFQSKRRPASDYIHVFDVERPGQVRGPAWLGAAILNLRDFDDYEDAELVRQKIAACFAAFVSAPDGDPLVGEPSATAPLVEEMTPGMVKHLAPGEEVTFGTPPAAQSDGFSVRTLRRIAASIGVTYEEMTGDYSQVNYSSGRMGWIRHWTCVEDWRWTMLIPMFCDGAWSWAVQAAQVAGLLRGGAAPSAVWTAPPRPMLDPEKEGLAAVRKVRAGQMDPDEMVREQGLDPDKHWPAYAKALKRLDDLGIKLDSDVRAVSQAGLTQERVGSSKDQQGGGVAGGG